MPHLRNSIFSHNHYVFINLCNSSREFDRVVDPNTNRTVVDAESFHYVEQNPVKPFDIIQAVPKGMEAASQIIFFIFVVGGSFQIITATGTIEAGIGILAKIKW